MEYLTGFQLDKHWWTEISKVSSHINRSNDELISNNMYSITRSVSIHQNIQDPSGPYELVQADILSLPEKTKHM